MNQNPLRVLQGRRADPAPNPKKLASKTTQQRSATMSAAARFKNRLLALAKEALGEA